MVLVADVSMKIPTLREVFLTMTQYGGLTFGGGGPTIAALQSETMDRRGWINNSQFQLAYALSRLTPGTNLLAFCTALGWQMRGIPGAVAALIASSLPCSIITVGLTILFDAIQGNRWAAIAIEGASASAIGIIAASCWQLIAPHVAMGTWLRTTVLVLGALLLQIADVPPIRILLLAGILGALWREES